ncbi:LCP family protein [Streptacidiphilus sp. PB12-B1b]|nr:LCP family protein [Streptacidiphilus sp. PB12-B1b]
MLKIVGLTTAGVLVVAGGGVTYLYLHLAGNIKTGQLYTGTDRKDAVGVEIPNKFGQTPLNVLLIGSDTRDTKADCDLGGACAQGGQGANADVEMLVHLSADRSNITVMSIPRDLITNLPACTDPGNGTSVGPRYKQINQTLQYGPSCTAMAVHKLTGITVDDFAMVDFGGVVNLSNALGGVKVCVSSNMYDINSGLKLTAGTHTLQGLSALQFLRTRDSFGDGSDNVGRTGATHTFFTDMINKLKSAGTVSDVPAMYSIANAATKSLTVSPDLNTPLKLISLAQQLNKVPADRITFATMQNVDDQHDFHVTEGPQAPVLFNAIRNDQSLTTASGGSSGAGSAAGSAAGRAAATTGAAPSVPLSGIAVAVYNGASLPGQSGHVPGRAGQIAAALISDGFSSGTAAYDDSGSPASTSLTYGPGQAAQAQATAKVLGLPAADVKQGAASGLKLVIGADWTSGTAFPNSKPAPAPVDTAAALNNTFSQNGGTSQCVKVSPDKTENKLGLPTATWNSPPETPAQMFQIYANRPNSAP